MGHNNYRSFVLLLVAIALLVGCVAPSLANSAIKPLASYDSITPDVNSLFETSANDIGFRLPNNTRPLAYSIHLTTRIDTQTDFTFVGTVAITLLGVGAASNTITLHHRNLTIISAQLTRSSAPDVHLPLVEPPIYTAANELLTYTLEAAVGNLITAGERFVLTIRYAGVLRTDTSGFYRSSYTNESGQKRWLATTQFEQTDARHAFPCYDEPALRSRFTVKITHGSTYHAISNMPVDGTPQVVGDITTTTFQETPLSPTYLIAFVVSDFASISGTTEKGFVQRVFARPNAIEDGAFALDTGLKSLSAFEKYFNIPFKLPKMDQAAIPDLNLIAMENWGLVLYVESYLLYNSSRSTFADKNNIATVISHEYAHQYFGNLVTPKWWSYIWLNEGFADLFENIATDWLFPEWKIMDAFVLTAHKVMIEDSTNRTRPMTHYVDSPREISKLFDTIAYAKSAYVLHMFRHAFTESTFKKALINYLNKMSLSEATEDDLFDALETATKVDGTLAANFDVATIMRSWTNHAGYPILSVERSYTNSSITLKQQRYFSEPQATVTPNIWWIPYNWVTASSANSSKTAATNWLGTNSATINVTDLKTSDWLMLNNRQTGYYRVQYDEYNYELLAVALQKDPDAIHLVGRAQLLNDAFEFARVGLQSYSAALEMSKYLSKEVEYVPWAAAWRGFSDIERLLSSSPIYPKYKTYALKLIELLFLQDRLEASDGEHHYRKQARVQMIHWACENGRVDCQRIAYNQLTAFLVNGTKIHQDHRAAILCQGVRNATDTQFDQLLSLLQNENDQAERYRFIDALACASTTKQLKDLVQASTRLDMRWNSDSERYRVFVQVVKQYSGWQVAVEFLLTNLQEVATSYGSSNVNAAFGKVAENVNSDERKSKFNDLIAAAQRTNFIQATTIQSAQRKLEDNFKWLSTNRKVIEDFMKKNSASARAISIALIMLSVFMVQMF